MNKQQFLKLRKETIEKTLKGRKILRVDTPSAGLVILTLDTGKKWEIVIESIGLGEQGIILREHINEIKKEKK